MSISAARARAGRDRTSLYQEITDKIIAELQAGRVPWVQPWGTAAAKSVLSHAGERGDPPPLFRPQGAKLVGLYDSQIPFGQDRLLLVWTRLIMPNGRSIVLERNPAPTRKDSRGSRTRSISIRAG